MKIQPLLYIFQNLWCRCRSECQDRNSRKIFSKFNYSKIRWPEIITPLGDTMRFINRYKVYIHLLNSDLEDFSTQPFRGKIQKLIITIYCVIQSHINLIS